MSQSLTIAETAFASCPKESNLRLISSASCRLLACDRNNAFKLSTVSSICCSGVFCILLISISLLKLSFRTHKDRDFLIENERLEKL